MIRQTAELDDHKSAFMSWLQAMGIIGAFELPKFRWASGRNELIFLTSLMPNHVEKVYEQRMMQSGTLQVKQTLFDIEFRPLTISPMQHWVPTTITSKSLGMQVKEWKDLAKYICEGSLEDINDQTWMKESVKPILHQIEAFEYEPTSTEKAVRNWMDEFKVKEDNIRIRGPVICCVETECGQMTAAGSFKCLGNSTATGCGTNLKYCYWMAMALEDKFYNLVHLVHAKVNRLIQVLEILTGIQGTTTAAVRDSKRPLRLGQMPWLDRPGAVVKEPAIKDRNDRNPNPKQTPN